jgi:hypothetical protein
LFFWWITGNLPFNTTPLFVDIVTSILLPRILILVWIYQSMGICAWFWIHLVTMFVTWGISLIRPFIKGNKV